jgi:MinD-like ATPase involved in chromosome partitioning or flagellar assembly
VTPTRLPVLVAASGAAWETDALRRLDRPGSGVVLLRRCVDLRDLLAAANTGQARAALVTDSLPGLDADSVSRLHQAGLAVVVVEDRGSPNGGPTSRFPVDGVLPGDALDGLAETLRAAAARSDGAAVDVDGPAPAGQEVRPVPRRAGRRIVVWGPAGAPGRTTLAVALAAETARRGTDAFLLDADPYGGAVGQHLGVLDEVSGVLAAARAANAGRLDVDHLSGIARQVAPGLRVLTGLPRADRWPEVREGAFTDVIDAAAALCPVLVLDTGFCLEGEPADPFGAPAPARNTMTLSALAQADEVLVVGAADPVGLARLARGLVELREVVPSVPVRVAVNRMRASLGWGEKEIRAMVEGFLRPESVHFLPEDRAAADRAVVAGKSLVETGDSALRRAVASVADAVLGEPAPVRRRRAGRGR